MRVLPASQRFSREAQRELRSDLEVVQQKGSLIEPLPPKPAGDFVVALARVAGATNGYDVFERVSTASRNGEDAVALQWLFGLAAVGAACPCGLECGPLHIGQVVSHSIQPAFAAAGGPGLATPTYSHRSSVRLRGAGDRRRAHRHARDQP